MQRTKFSVLYYRSFFSSTKEQSEYHKQSFRINFAWSSVTGFQSTGGTVSVTEEQVKGLKLTVL